MKNGYDYGYGDDNSGSSSCYFHPKEAIVGVCPVCLHERLVILASKQNQTSSKAKSVSDKRPLKTKVFAFRSLLNRFEFRNWKSTHTSHVPQDEDDGFEEDDDDDDACSSQEEESFISIKFENNGAASWEKGTVSSNVSSWSKQQSSNKIQSVIEHAKPRGSLRWRKRIGHLLQLLRWKRSTKVAVEAGGVKVIRKGWIRTLTKRTTKPPFYTK